LGYTRYKIHIANISTIRHPNRTRINSRNLHHSLHVVLERVSRDLPPHFTKKKRVLPQIVLLQQHVAQQLVAHQQVVDVASRVPAVGSFSRPTSSVTHA